MTNEELRKILVDNSDIADEILLRINTSGKQLSDISVNEALGNTAEPEPEAPVDSGYSFGTLSNNEPAGKYEEYETAGYAPSQDETPSWGAQSKSKYQKDEFGNYRPGQGGYRIEQDTEYANNSGVLPRKTLKALAKLHIKENYGALCKNMVIMLLIIMGISAVGSVISSICMGTETSGGVIAGAIITLIVAVISFIVSCGLTFGYTKGFMNARRGEEVESIFAHFNKWLDVFKLNLLMLLKAGWPMLVATVIYSIIIAIAGEDSPLTLIGSVLMVAGYIYMFYKLIEYALSMFLYVDDDSKLTFSDASAILRKSRDMMRGHKLSYFIIVLSFIGWYIVLYFALYLPLFSMLAVVGIRHEINIAAFLFAAFIILILAIILMLPLVLYIMMTFTEFYDSRCGRDPRNNIPEIRKSIIRTPLIALVAATVLCTTLAFVPGVPMDLNSLIGMNNTQNTYNDQDSILQDYDDDNDDFLSQDNTQDQYDPGTNNSSSIIPPAGYTVSYDQNGLTTLYTEDASDSISIFRNEFTYDDEYVSSAHPNASKEYVGGKTGYLYTDGDVDYMIYGFIFNTGNDSSIEVTVTDPNVMEQIVSQL